MSKKLREAAQAAYKAMIAAELSDGSKREWDAAVDGLKDALAEPEEKLLSVHRLDQWLKAALAEPKQEPVGKFSKFSDGVWKEVTASSPGQLLYAAPPRREWVALTEDEIWTLHDSDSYPSPVEFARAIETMLRERNGG